MEAIENNIKTAYDFFYNNIDRLYKGGKISEAATKLQLEKLNLFIASFNKMYSIISSLEFENMELAHKSNRIENLYNCLWKVIENKEPCDCVIKKRNIGFIKKTKWNNLTEKQTKFIETL